MINVLTKKEVDFFTMLAALVDDYNVYFSCNESGGISIVICDELEPECQNNPVCFPTTFDESEIARLLQNNLRLAGYVAKEFAAGSYQIESFLKNSPDEKANESVPVEK